MARGQGMTKGKRHYSNFFMANNVNVNYIKPQTSATVFHSFCRMKKNDISCPVGKPPSSPQWIVGVRSTSNQYSWSRAYHAEPLISDNPIGYWTDSAGMHWFITPVSHLLLINMIWAKSVMSPPGGSSFMHVALYAHTLCCMSLHLFLHFICYLHIIINMPSNCVLWFSRTT